MIKNITRFELEPGVFADRQFADRPVDPVYVVILEQLDVYFLV